MSGKLNDPAALGALARVKLASAQLQREIKAQRERLAALEADPDFIRIFGDVAHPMNECVMRGRHAMLDQLASSTSMLRDLKRAHRARSRKRRV